MSVLLALGSALLFGSMTVALRPAMARGDDPLLGALLTVLTALAVALAAAIVVGRWDIAGTWPFLLAGVLGPGLSQLLFTFAVRDAGPSRTSATVGMAPLFAVLFAVVLLGEPVVAGIVAGAVLIVSGGILLAGERGRPAHVKATGLVLALAAALVFALRDTFVRWLSVDTGVSPALATLATLTSGALTILVVLLVARRPLSLRAIPAYVPAGLLFGLSYVCLFEAFYRGRLSVVSPLVATESLWGVGLSAVFLRRHELVGPRLAAGAALVVAGGVLIGVFR
ncbi:EamA-like transporter family [Gaiella occulta]|uniref:EamA-like transporter family n=1 Tax=Gaiella occulta TaxID=1002870 RepID=A0A7M2YWU2_9ACTN|nr:DMT family transporter [Gaiella occulta]RDI73947.1 EamA-like transporter family [Gaiella occulta]